MFILQNPEGADGSQSKWLEMELEIIWYNFVKWVKVCAIFTILKTSSSGAWSSVNPRWRRKVGEFLLLKDSVTSAHDCLENCLWQKQLKGWLTEFNVIDTRSESYRSFGNEAVERTAWGQTLFRSFFFKWWYMFTVRQCLVKLVDDWRLETPEIIIYISFQG